MRCMAFTKRFQRCKRESITVFCHQHWYYPFAIFFAILSFTGLIAGLYRDLWAPIFYADKNAIHNNNIKTDQANSTSTSEQQGKSIDKGKRNSLWLGLNSGAKARNILWTKDPSVLVRIDSRVQPFNHDEPISDFISIIKNHKVIQNYEFYSICKSGSLTNYPITELISDINAPV